MPAGSSATSVAHGSEPVSRRLVAVDLGLRTGLAVYGHSGRLERYRSHNLGTRARLKRAAAGILAEHDPVAAVVLEGDATIARPWLREADSTASSPSAGWTSCRHCSIPDADSDRRDRHRGRRAPGGRKVNCRLSTWRTGRLVDRPQEVADLGVATALEDAAARAVGPTHLAYAARIRLPQGPQGHAATWVRAGCRIRTDDLLFTRQLLCRLS
jgi:hypothetical protein